MSGDQCNSGLNSLTCSAPAKVLLTGGYLVLEHPNSGLVVAVSARFYSTVNKANAPIGTPTNSEAEKISFVRVYSPQFQSTDIFAIHWAPSKYLVVRSQCGNPFIRFSIQFALGVALHNTPGSFATLFGPHGLEVEIRGDNDFYCQTDQLQLRHLPRNSEGLRALPRFLPAHQAGHQLKKTGLGSSSALVTSLVAALLQHFGVISLPPRTSTASQVTEARDRALLHNVAQLAHCLAQGKIGSGFDVSCAVYGSQRYVRFDPKVLQPLMYVATEGGTETPVTLDTLWGCVDPANPEWNSQHTPFTLPPGLALVMGDIDGGSRSPILSSQVLTWKKANGELALALWNDIAAANRSVEESLAAFSQLAAVVPSAEYDRTLQQLAGLTADQWGTATHAHTKLVQTLLAVREAFVRVRRLMKRMGQEAGAAIEPDEQTELVDATMALPGVVAAAVPGAGGYDAIWALTVGPEVVKKVEERWSSWKKMNVLPLILRQDPHGVCVDTLQ